MAVAVDPSARNFELAQVAWKGKIRTYARNSFHGIPGFDADDVEQELLSVLWKCVQTYDPIKGATFNTYAQQSFRNRISDLKRSANQLKRKADLVSLDEESVQIAVDERIQVMSAEDAAMLRVRLQEVDPATVLRTMGVTDRGEGQRARNINRKRSAA